MNASRIAWGLGRWYMGLPARLVTRPAVYGLDRVPATGGLVYAINHMHWIDVPLVGAISPRNIDFVAKVEATSLPGMGKFLEWHGTIAVRRDVHVGRDDADASRVAGPIIDGGYRGFDPAAPVVGGVDRVAEAFADLGVAGCTDVIVRHLRASGYAVRFVDMPSDLAARIDAALRRLNEE